MIELLADHQWHGSDIGGSGSPTLNYSVSYEAERPNPSSATVRARFTIVMRSLYSDCYFGYPLYCSIDLNNTEYTITSNFGSGVKSVEYTTGWIEFSSTGTSKVVAFTPRCGDLSHTYRDEATIYFGGMTQYPTFTTQPSIVSKGINSVTFNFGATDIASNHYYSTDNSSWTKTTLAENTITNLEPNKEYTIYCKATNQSDESLATTVTLTATTYDIARISSVNSFNLGDSTSITITNPANATAGLAMLIGETQILTKSLTTGANTITFTDTQIDNIYKKYGTSNTVTVSYVLTTNNNGSWTDTKTVTCILTGNIKTGDTNVDGSYKRAKRWVNVNGTWKRCVRWINVNGNWRRCT